MMSKMSFLMHEDYLIDEIGMIDKKDENLLWNYEIWKIYAENPKQPLYVLDSLAKQLYSEYFYENKAKLITMVNKVNSHWKDYFDYQGIERFSDFIDLRNQTIDQWFLNNLNYFPDSTRKELKEIKDYGIDLNATDAYAQLKALDIPTTEITGILQYHLKRQSEIRSLQREKDAREDKKTLSELYETTVFSVKQLGWINCDRFYEDPKADKAEILLANSSTHPLNFIDFSLVIPDLNVRLMSFPRKSNLYSFTNETGPYTKLPIGKEAVVIGVSVHNDSVFYASQNIKIKDGLRLDLKMEYIDAEVLGDSLALVLNME